MLSKNCVGKCSSHKSSLRQPIYSNPSRYQRSIKHRFDGTQHSPSISVSDEQQRLTHIELTNNVNSCETNGLAKSRGEQVRHAVTIRETADCREYVRSMSRDSNSSQLTMMSSLSKGFNEGNNNVTANECPLKTHKSPKAVILGTVDLLPSFLV